MNFAKRLATCVICTLSVFLGVSQPANARAMYRILHKPLLEEDWISLKTVLEPRGFGASGIENLHHLRFGSTFIIRDLGRCSSDLCQGAIIRGAKVADILIPPIYMVGDQIVQRQGVDYVQIWFIGEKVAGPTILVSESTFLIDQ